MAVPQLQHERERAAVFGYRLMFSPETQPIRQTLVGHIIFIQLAESDRKEGESAGKLTTLTVNGVKILTFSLDETRAALKKLVVEGLAEKFSLRKKARWRITDEGRRRIETDRGDAERRIDSVTEALFGGCSPIDEYRTAFLESLTDIFGRLAREYIELSFARGGDVAEGGRAATRDIETVAQKVLSRFPSLDGEEFSAGLRRFFREEHPDATWLKWTYCKNYYSLRIIGLGDLSEALSKEVFSGTKAYLDTNVLIDALDSTSPNYAAVTQTIVRMREVGGDIGVLGITVQELKDLARKQGDKLDTVLRQIPDELLPRVQGVVARAKASHLNDPNKPSAKMVLADFENAENLIKNHLQAAVVQDELFEGERESDKIVALAGELKQHYDLSSPLWRRKTQDAAIHDALALQFVSEKRSEGENCVFVTLDGSLPTFRLTTVNTAVRFNFNNVMTVDALLPWLGMVSQDDDVVSRAYSSLLANQLVATRKTFSMNEFRMLAEIGMDCGQMPAEDVEQCLLYLRREAKGIDLRKAEDREKLHHTVRLFFSSPERKYLSEISGLRDELSDMTRTLAQVNKDAEEKFERGREKLADYEGQMRIGRVKQRLTVVGAIFSLGVIVCLWLSNSFGAGDNFVQRIGGTWWLFGFVVTASGFLVRVLCPGELWVEAKRLLWPVRDS